MAKVVQKFLLITTMAISLFVLHGFQLVSAATLPVELTIPETVLQVAGRASPDALVSVREGGNVITSTTADSDGNFFTSVNRTAGLHTISVNYVDINGVPSQTNTQTISVAPQQTTTQTLFLSPTLSRISTNSIVTGGIVQLRGYSLPNALVTIRVDYNVFIYETVSDAKGFYEFLLDSRLIGLGNHIASTTTTKGPSLSDTSPITSFEIIPANVPSPPDIVVAPSQLPPPLTQFPNDGAIIDSDRVVIYGESLPSAQINIYENNMLYGSVFADEFGKWSFEYFATFSPVTLTFEACINGRCSVLSRSLTLEFSNLNKQCRIELIFEEYRFWGVETGSSVELKMLNSSAGVMNIFWGDGTIEQFNNTGDVSRSFKHTYDNSGNYNGKVVLQQGKDGSCKKERFFSVSVISKPSNDKFKNLLILLTLIAGLLALNYVNNRDKQNSVQKH